MADVGGELFIKGGGYLVFAGEGLVPKSDGLVGVRGEGFTGKGFDEGPKAGGISFVGAFFYGVYPGFTVLGGYLVGDLLVEG